MVLALACPFLTADTFQWSMRGASQSGPATLIGRPQITTLDGGGWWEAVLSSIPATKSDTVGYLQTIQALADSGAAPIVVPCFAKKTAPWPLDGNGKQITSSDDLPFSDDTLLSDGTGFSQFLIDYSVIADAPLRATSIFLQLLNGSGLRGIEWFSFDHAIAGRRLYRIISAVEQSTGVFACTIRPPLREAISAGDRPDFDAPACTMVMNGPSGLDVDHSRLGTAMLPSAKFLEAP